MANCKICDKQTEVEFVIKQRAVPICKNCASTIFFQQARTYTEGGSIYDLTSKYKVNRTQSHPKIALEVLNYLNQVIGKKFRYKLEDIRTKHSVALDHISARINEGFTEKQLKAVIYHRNKEWKSDPKMSKYMRAMTLFNKEKFQTYVTQLPEELNPVNTKEQRELIRKLNIFGVRGIKNEETDQLARELRDTGFEREDYLKRFLI